jgi:hypothetical protein
MLHVDDDENEFQIEQQMEIATLLEWDDIFSGLWNEGSRFCPCHIGSVCQMLLFKHRLLSYETPVVAWYYNAQQIVECQRHT